MHPTKPYYLEALREETSYRFERRLIKLFTVIVYALAAILFIFALVSGIVGIATTQSKGDLGAMFVLLNITTIITGALTSIGMAIAGRLTAHVMITLTDQADSTIDRASRETDFSSHFE